MVQLSIRVCKACLYSPEKTIFICCTLSLVGWGHDHRCPGSQVVMGSDIEDFLFFGLVGYTKGELGGFPLWCFVYACHCCSIEVKLRWKMVLKWFNFSANVNWSWNGATVVEDGPETDMRSFWNDLKCVDIEYHVNTLGNVNLLHLVEEVAMLGRGFYCLWLTSTFYKLWGLLYSYLSHCKWKWPLYYLVLDLASLHDKVSPTVVQQCAIHNPLVNMGYKSLSRLEVKGCTGIM